MRTFLAQAQAKHSRTAFSWGLHMGNSERKSEEYGIERGFVNNRWPIQREDLDGVTMKSTTYVEDGRLIQAVVVASEKRTSVDWRIGGRIQLVEGQQFEENLSKGPKIAKHSVEESVDGTTLSVSCDSKYRLDVKLFDNGKPLILKGPMIDGENQRDFANMFCSGTLKHMVSYGM